MNFKDIQALLNQGKTLLAIKGIKTFYKGIPLKKAKELVNGIRDGTLNAGEYQKVVAAYSTSRGNYGSNFTNEMDYRLIERLKDLVRKDQLILAIKELREVYPSLNLKEAKEFIIKLEAGNLTNYQAQTLLDNMPKYT